MVKKRKRTKSPKLSEGEKSDDEVEVKLLPAESSPSIQDSNTQLSESLSSTTQLAIDAIADEPICRLSTKKRVLVERIINRITRLSTIEGFSEAELLEVLDASYQQLRPQPTLVHVDVPVVIFGDIHGQLADLQRFLAIVGTPPRTKLLFLGDYVDRCNKGLEVALLLLCYKLRYPGHIDMLRGNHECSKMNRIYGFYSECRAKMSVKMWKAFQRAFDELPLCARVGKRILAMHGGISPDIHDWNSLLNLKKPRTNAECDEGICLDLMWSDPSRDDCTKGFQPNTDRGTSYLFGDDMVRNFNRKLDIDLVVRAHEVVKRGHLFNASYQMCTIFSAPNYCGSEGNCASVMRVSKRLEVSFVTLKPKMSSAAKLQLSKNEILVMQERFLSANAKSPKPGAFRSTESAFVIHKSEPESGQAANKTTLQQKPKDSSQGKGDEFSIKDESPTSNQIPDQFEAPLSVKSEPKTETPPSPIEPLVAQTPPSSSAAGTAITAAVAENPLTPPAIDLAAPIPNLTLSTESSSTTKTAEEEKSAKPADQNNTQA